jgi:hypothetical protein
MYDRKLKMYKMSESILKESHDIGRARAFTPGWLENESVFLHMEYKYMYSILKAGLYNEFFEDMKTVFIPFLEPEIYGRSTIENSSFIASSANPDPATHGVGNVARLSGSTAEFLSMWSFMTAGEKPFDFDNGKLIFRIKPVLPAWLFADDNSVKFRLLGGIEVTLNNPQRKDTFGINGAVVKGYELTYKDGVTAKISGTTVEGTIAEDVRALKVAKIVVELA